MLTTALLQHDVLGNISALPTSSDGVLIARQVVSGPALKFHFGFCFLRPLWYQPFRSFIQETYSYVDLPASVLLGSTLGHTCPGIRKEGMG